MFNLSTKQFNYSVADVAIRRQSTCPVCSATTRFRLSVVDVSIFACDSCSHEHTDLTLTDKHLETIYGDSYFFSGGHGYNDYFAEADLLEARGECYGKLLSGYMTPGRVLDVGAAAGFVLKGLMNQGWNGIGLEPNPTMVQVGQKQNQLTMVQGCLEAYYSHEQFDLITMIQVLPHFFNVREALATASHLTRPGGYWLIEGWNKDSLTARLLGRNWHEYCPPSVLHWFTPSSLTQLAGDFGFKQVATGRPKKYISAGHAKSLLRYKVSRLPSGNAFMTLLNVLPDQLVIPYPAEDLFWMLLRKEGAGS